MPYGTLNADTITNSNGLSGNAIGPGFKNRIINGAMSFWQRGTSFTNPAVSGNFYTADRWGVNRAGDVTGATVSQSTDVPSGFQYSLKLQRTAGNTSTAGLYLFNSNETANTRDLAGQSVTISFWVKTGANYSGGALSVQGYWGTGTDQRVYAYTGATAFINTTQAITSTWTRYSFTGTVGASSTEVGFQCFWTPTGTAGADDSIYITGVQFEVGPSATSFDYRPYGTELALCQRYYQQFGGAANRFPLIQLYATNTNFPVIPISFVVQMRTEPTVTKEGTWAAVNCGQPSVLYNSSYGISFGFTMTATGLAEVYPNSTDDRITASAEL